MQASSLASHADPVETFIIEQEVEELRREIALLSGSYRDVIVSYYLKGRSYDETATAVGLPLSTVKWRLHEARRILEEGLSTMREFGQLSHDPKRIDVGSYGNWHPGDFLRSLLRQNIFVASYSQPVSIADLAVELGVSSAFIEDEVSEMVKCEVLERTPSNKVRATFILHTADANDDTRPIMTELEETIVPILDIALERLPHDLRERGLDFKPKEWNRLLPSIVPDLIYTACERLERNITSYDRMPKHANGQAGWGTAWEVRRQSISRSTVRSSGSRYGWVDQVIYWTGSYGWRKLLDVSDQDLICNVVYDANGNNQNAALTSQEVEDKLSLLVASGHIVRDNDSLEPRFTVFTKEEKEKYDAVARPLVEPIRAAMETAHKALVGKLLRHVPDHLHDQVQVFALCVLANLPLVVSKMVAAFDQQWPYGMRLVVEHGRN
jgi:hypothetical protein